jgi:hypothetical protein
VNCPRKSRLSRRTLISSKHQIGLYSPTTHRACLQSHLPHHNQPLSTPRTPIPAPRKHLFSYSLRPKQPSRNKNPLPAMPHVFLRLSHRLRRPPHHPRPPVSTLSPFCKSFRLRTENVEYISRPDPLGYRLAASRDAVALCLRASLQGTRSVRDGAYTWTECDATLDDGEVLRGVRVFVWAGDAESMQLDKGSFDLERYRNFFKRSVLRDR